MVLACNRVEKPIHFRSQNGRQYVFRTRPWLIVFTNPMMESAHGYSGKSYLLSEDGFGLATKTLLLSVVTPPTLGELGLLRLFVLSHLPLLVIPAHGMLAISHTDLRQVHLKDLKNAVNKVLSTLPSVAIPSLGF